MKWSVIIGSVLLFFALGLKPLISLAKEKFFYSDIDPQIGQLEVLSDAELTKFYGKHRTLVVGGTRGIGRGIARAIVRFGGDVAVVGRSAKSGEATVSDLKSHARSASQRVSFIPGDLGSVRTTRELLHTLQAETNKQGRFDNLVVTASVFPDWGDLMQEDGLEKNHAITVVGRYMLYRYMNLYLKEGARVLHVLGAGSRVHKFDRDVLEGKRNISSIFECLFSTNAAAELVQLGLQRSGQFHNTTRVNTHPGLIITELHLKQGWLFDSLITFLAMFSGMSEDESGIREASILASPRLHPGGLSYVDDNLIGRVAGEALERSAAENLPSLMAWINQRTEL